jgi:glycosylphosphatidylinositol transamidase (GPIT) subunit GPI8
MADDLASNKKNPYPGQVIRDNLSLENLYTDVTIDYKLEDLTPVDLKQILLGRRSEKLPTVLDSTDGHNVLLIWTGHGVPGSMLWDDSRNIITGSYMSDLFKEMYSAGKYRKMFGVIEACYSGSVAMECVGVPKLLLMTATNDKETSKAELYSSVWRTYLTNSFNAAVLKTLQERNIHVLSVKDLYTEVFSQTMGSHVTLYNAENFGNVFFNPIGPFFSN